MMEFGFLFWVFLIGIGIASFQDLKRREVDNWLNVQDLHLGPGLHFQKNGDEPLEADSRCLYILD